MQALKRGDACWVWQVWCDHEPAEAYCAFIVGFGDATVDVRWDEFGAARHRCIDTVPAGCVTRRWGKCPPNLAR